MIMADDYQPRVDSSGVPFCNRERCVQYGGKRCRMTGFRPYDTCEPALIDLVAEVRRLRALLPTAEERAALAVLCRQSYSTWSNDVKPAHEYLDRLLAATEDA